MLPTSAADHPSVAKYDLPPVGSHWRDTRVRYSATNADMTATSAMHHKIYLSHVKLLRCLRTLVTGMRDAHNTPSTIHIHISRLNVCLPACISSISTIHPGLYSSTKNSRNAGIASTCASSEGTLSSFLGISIICAVYFFTGTKSENHVFRPYISDLVIKHRYFIKNRAISSH